LLAVSGKLDLTAGGPDKPLTDKFARRAVYGTVNRTTPDRTLTLFDFPDPKSHAEDRSVTIGPLQRLWFMNSAFMMDQATALAKRVESAGGLEEQVSAAYELLYSRPPNEAEIAVAREFLAEADWSAYAQMLLASSEFFTIR